MKGRTPIFLCLPEWGSDRTMKHIPIIYPISFILIIGITFFAGAYGIAEGAGPRSGAVQSYAVLQPAEDLAFVEKAALWVCPLH